MAEHSYAVYFAYNHNINQWYQFYIEQAEINIAAISGDNDVFSEADNNDKGGEKWLIVDVFGQNNIRFGMEKLLINYTQLKTSNRSQNSIKSILL
ncbi:hypothetical protein L1887_17024 [Cichorium endivia]|nr:hypothetical protein L1887_17024 [Cichorium endivia]